MLGAGASLSALKPVTALVWAAVINGIVAVPVMALLVLMATRADILGKFKIPRAWTAVGWIATGTMAISAIAFVVLSLRWPVPLGYGHRARMPFPRQWS